MKITTGQILAAAGLALGACTVPVEPAGTAPVTPDFARAGGTWSSGGAIEAAVGLVRADDRIAVCGAWTTTPQSILSKRHNDDVVEAGSVWLGGAPLVRGLGFMTRLPEGSPLAGATARCVRTARPWPEGGVPGDPVVHLPRQAFEYDEESGPLAIFHQTRS